MFYLCALGTRTHATAFLYACESPYWDNTTHYLCVHRIRTYDHSLLYRNTLPKYYLPYSSTRYIYTRLHTLSYGYVLYVVQTTRISFPLRISQSEDREYIAVSRPRISLYQKSFCSICREMNVFTIPRKANPVGRLFPFILTTQKASAWCSTYSPCIGRY